MRDLWAIITTKYNDQFPELIKLAQIVTLIPVSTADCDSGDLVIEIGIVIEMLISWTPKFCNGPQTFSRRAPEDPQI